MTRVWKKLKSNKLNSEESGYILIMSLFVLIILFLIGTTLAVLGIQEFTLSSRTKLMDQAYAIADAGINRAAVALQMDTNLTRTTTPGPYPNTPQSGPFTENFGGGSFTWTLYQSNLMPNPTYKIIQSRGTISKSGRTAERTIETSIIVGAGGDEYDASFDYLFYNGNKDAYASGQTPAVWPDTTRLGGYVSGNYTWDGYTSFNGHPPRGAVYTKGSINIPVFLLGGLTIKGNVVATDDITLQNQWSVGFTQSSGITIDNSGKVIAGLDGTGNAYVNLSVTGSASTQMQINGQMIAAQNVTVNATANINLFDPALTINGIKAGNNVTIKGVANLSKSLQLGSIIAGNLVTIKSDWASGVTANSIYAGQDAGTGDGVVLNTSVAGSINVGNIASRGRVNATATLAGISMGSVTAGNSTAAAVGGTGVAFNMNAAGCSVYGNITSTGLVDLNSNWFASISTRGITAGTDSATGSGGTGIYLHGSGLSSISTNGQPLTATGAMSLQMPYGNNLAAGAVWCGSDVTASTNPALWVAGGTQSYGNISTVGNLNLNAGTGAPWAGGISSGTITSMGSVTLLGCGDFNQGSVYSNSNIWIQNTSIGGVCRQNGTIQSRGTIHWEGTAAATSGGANSWVRQGMWGNYIGIWRDDIFDVSDTDLNSIGRLPDGINGDSLRSATSIETHPCGDIIFWNPDIYIDGAVHYNGGWSGKDGFEINWSGETVGGVVLPNPISVPTPSVPAKPNPVYVDRNGALNEPGPQGQAKNVDVLYEANLTATVDLLKPNWDYFETMATEDDASNPAAPHMIYDGDPGDDDGLTNGVVQLKWDTSKPYSNRETIYIADPVPLEIKALNWSNHGAEFSATIVSQKTVTITAPNTDWLMNSSQMLNVVSGNDILCTTAGLTLWENADCQYHFWADHNIDLTNMRFSLGGNQVYRGSFTAGNRVYMADNSFWPNSTFAWSRWALDPVAWAPPFQVLTWKEI